MQAAILANVALIADGVQSKQAHVKERVKQVTAALTFHDIPSQLIQRVVDSIEYYASQNYGTQDREIMEVFPERYLEPHCELEFMPNVPAAPFIHHARAHFQVANGCCPCCTG
jgi:hypothetical protein